MNAKVSHPIVDKALTVAVTTVVVGVLGFFGGLFEKGATAISEDQIEIVVGRMLTTDAGKTYAARISELDGEVLVLETRVGIVVEDLNSLEFAVGTLVRD
jgi:hypothetical protein